MAPLLGSLYLARHLVGLPFAPYDAFDWITRRLPGPVVTRGIDAMVAVIRALELGETSGAAKTAEKLLAVGGVLVFGGVIGAALFGFLRRVGSRWGVGAGGVAGALVGLPLAWLGVRHPGAVSPIAGAIGVFGSFAAWGALVGWTYGRLSAPTEGAAPLAAERMDRRRFIVRLGSASAVITVVGAGIGSFLAMRRERSELRGRDAPWSERNPLPNEGASVAPVPGTRPELTPLADHYRIDIDTRPPELDAATWRLRVGGLVERPLSLSLAELRERYEPRHQFVTLACISNPIGGDLIGTTRWTGLRLAELLADARPAPSATHVRMRAADGFHEVVALDEVRADPRILLAYAWDGLPLTAEHGFPLRVYLPGRYGMKQPKWIERIELIDHWEPGYWVERGWDREARMKPTSVIDTVGASMMVIAPSRSMVVPIGGIAHAGARGISRVEVRVDGGPWQEAKLRAPLSELTWVLWRFDWRFEAGEHVFAVRCFDGDGVAQVAEPGPVRPDGATGLHSERLML